MRNYVEDVRKNIKYIDWILSRMNQGFLNPKSVEEMGFLRKIPHYFPVWYNCLWVGIYMYCIFGEMAGLEIVSEQMWCMMSIMQLLAKLINCIVQQERQLSLLKWCENVYTEEYKPLYKPIVHKIWEKTNIWIYMLMRINSLLVALAVSFYLAMPIYLGNRAVPTPISINGNSYWPKNIFLTLYITQCIHAYYVFLSLSGYDAIFIQCTMSMKYRFRTLSDMLKLLNEDGERNHRRDKEILVDIYKYHLDVLEIVESFRSYYFLYGLAALGSNLLANCSILYILQTIGFDIGSFAVLLCSSTQVLIASAFGQQLQDEAANFSDNLYEIEWHKLNKENKNIVLLLMTGSERKVNIRAGGTYELNMALFAQIMKSGATLCAVMQAM